VPSFLVDGFRLTINTRDEKGHRPHCHVLYAGAEVLIRLDETLEAYDSNGMKPKDIKRARILVAAYYFRLLQIWSEKVEEPHGHKQDAKTGDQEARP